MDKSAGPGTTLSLVLLGELMLLTPQATEAQARDRPVEGDVAGPRPPDWPAEDQVAGPRPPDWPREDDVAPTPAPPDWPSDEDEASEGGALESTGGDVLSNGRMRTTPCVPYRARLGFALEDIAPRRGDAGLARLPPQMTGLGPVPDAALSLPDCSVAGASPGGVDALRAVDPASVARDGEAHLSAGRLEIRYDDHVVVGDLDWHPNGRALSGALGRIASTASAHWAAAFWVVMSSGERTSVMVSAAHAMAEAGRRARERQPDPLTLTPGDLDRALEFDDSDGMLPVGSWP